MPGFTNTKESGLEALIGFFVVFGRGEIEHNEVNRVHFNAIAQNIYNTAFDRALPTAEELQREIEAERKRIEEQEG